MTEQELVETIKGLVLGAKNSAMVPPFRVTVPTGFNLNASFFDGENDIGSLREALLSIESVKEVKVGPGRGCAVESIGSENEPRKGGA